MQSPFTPRTLSFLRALKRNNDREWFRARKGDYEQHVRAPMIELIARVAADLGSIAPELVADPKVSLYRIYRDTRFSEDKTPLKTNAAAVFPPRGFPRHEGAGLYVEIAPGWVWMGGGLYMPPATSLYAIRERIAATHPRLHRLVTTREFKAVLGELQGDRLTRVPRGYLKEHPAGEYLRFKQFLGFREFEPAFATSDRFYPELLRTFKALAPLVRFLNEAVRHSAATPPVLFHGHQGNGRSRPARRHAP
jgi:uncharacterized protein (TIGR02453 family)